MFNIIFVLFCVVGVIQAQYEEGDTCQFDEERSISGVCTIVHKCDYAKNRIFEDEVRVPTCGWNDRTQIVCCPEGLVHETGVFRSYFLSSDDGVIRNDDTICRYDGELPMMCCPKMPEYSPPPEPEGCPPLRRIKTPTFTERTHEVAWQKCIENRRYVQLCEKNERSLAGFSRTYACNVLDDVQRISGATKALHKEFPHMAVLGCLNNKEIDESGDSAPDIFWVGGGSLISDRYILTAAHVLNVNTYGPLKFALLGVLNKTDLRSGELFNVVRLLPHKRYVSTEKHDDIALLELDRQVTISEYVRPICLPVPGILYDDTQRIIAGWGERGSHWSTSNLLLKAYVNEVQSAECINSLKAQNFSWDDRTMTCARGLQPLKGQYPDSCHGDSGGPLMSKVKNEDLECNYVVSGVVSWGPNCGTGEPGAYTRVAPYIPWIVDTIWPENGSEEKNFR